MRRVGLFLLGMIAASGLASEPARGLLVYPDRNQLTGRLVAPGVFASDRFGEVRFKADEARFEAEEAPEPTRDNLAKAELAPEPVPAPAAPAAAGHPAPDWKFVLSGYLDRTKEEGEGKQEYIVNFSVNRPRTAGNKYLSRFVYEYAYKKGKVDKRKGTAEFEWRHDLGSSRWFTLARSFNEYDGTNLSDTEALLFNRSRLNYAMAQGQGGLGYRLLAEPLLTSNVAFTWSWFYIDVFDFLTVTADAPSLILENDLKLPWRLTLKQRGQIYYLKGNDTLGWENRLDLTRHLTPHLFLTLRHEYRNNYPVLSAKEINRIRLLFGAEF